MLIILIGTACRPEAALELTGEQLDFEGRADRPQSARQGADQEIPAGRQDARGAGDRASGRRDGRLVTFQTGRSTKINKAWRGMREAAGLDRDVNPYSIRHTVARWMRQNGVPAWEVAAQLGHKSRDYRTTELYAAFDPSYLSNAVRAINSLFDGPARQLRASGRALLQGSRPPTD